MLSVSICSSRPMLKVKYYTLKDREFYALYPHDPSMVLTVFVQENKTYKLTNDGIFGCIMKNYVSISQTSPIKY